MSTQFVFWRTSKRLDAGKVYERLMKGKTVRGLEPLDLDSVEAALIAALPDWEVSIRRSDANQQTAMDQNDGDGALDIGYSSQSVTVTCYRTNADVWNSVIDAMAGLKLPLYDPQINERFDTLDL